MSAINTAALELASVPDVRIQRDRDGEWTLHLGGCSCCSKSRTWPTRYGGEFDAEDRAEYEITLVHVEEAEASLAATQARLRELRRLLTGGLPEDLYR